MSNLITVNFFTRNLSIGQSSSIWVADSITQYIDKYESFYLLKVLGVDGYNEYVADPSNPKYNDLFKDQRTAYSYNIGCNLCSHKTGIWYGIANKDVLISPIANFVYYWFIRHTNEMSMGVGIEHSNAESGTIVSPQTKLTDAWNEMVDMTNALISLMNDSGNFTNSIGCGECSSPFHYINELNL